MPIITLTTDFGERDGFVGAMKGVILSLAPEAQVVDIAHDIEPQNIAQGAVVLATAALFFPPGTVHVAVVDPGVGSARRALAVQTERYLFLAPDNGLLTYALEEEPPLRAAALTNPRYFRHPVSATFHGRDIFAAVAAHWVRGVPWEELGPEVPLESLVRLPLPQVQRHLGALEGEVIYLDRFGNAMTNITARCLEREWGQEWRRLVQVCLPDGRSLPVVGSYSDGALGEPLALINSADRLEIAVRQGRADALLSLQPGSRVRVQRKEGG